VSLNLTIATLYLRITSFFLRTATLYFANCDFISQNCDFIFRNYDFQDLNGPNLQDLNGTYGSKCLVPLCLVYILQHHRLSGCLDLEYTSGRTEE